MELKEFIFFTSAVILILIIFISMYFLSCKDCIADYVNKNTYHFWGHIGDFLFCTLICCGISAVVILVIGCLVLTEYSLYFIPIYLKSELFKMLLMISAGIMVIGTIIMLFKYKFFLVTYIKKIERKIDNVSNVISSLENDLNSIKNKKSKSTSEEVLMTINSSEKQLQKEKEYYEMEESKLLTIKAKLSIKLKEKYKLF